MGEIIIKTRIYGKAEKIALFFITTLGAVFLGGLTALISGAYKGYSMLTVNGFTPPTIATSLVWYGLYLVMGLSLYLTVVWVPKSIGELNIKRWSIALWFLQFLISLASPILIFNGLEIAAFVSLTLLNGLLTSLAVLNLKIGFFNSALVFPYLAFSLMLTFAVTYNIAY